MIKQDNSEDKDFNMAFLAEMQATRRASERKQKRMDKMREKQIARADASLGIKPQAPIEHTSILRAPPDATEEQSTNDKGRGDWTAGPWMSAATNRSYNMFTKSSSKK